MAEGLGISKTQISSYCLRDCVPSNQKCRKGDKMTFYELCFE
ncbi:46486_t:CDS:1, partial [Gigaspora margarita]